MKSKNKSISVFIGYDPNEKIAYHTCVQSLIENSSVPLKITPLALPHFRKFYKRKKRKVDSTEFSISRFLVPYLSNFKECSIYLDCDIIVNSNLDSLINIVEKTKKNTALWCVKHNYKPSSKKKFLNKTQHVYNKKNWSSFMIFNNSKCKILTPNFIEKANGFDLHQFKWLGNKKITNLPSEWNILVGEQKIPKKIKGIHYTLGGPYFKKFSKCEKANIWINYFKQTIYPLKNKFF